MEKNNQTKIEIPNPTIRFLLLREMIKDKRENIMVKIIALINNRKISWAFAAVKDPSMIIGKPMPMTRLKDSDASIPKYKPKMIDFLDTGCERSSSMNSSEL